MSEPRANLSGKLVVIGMGVAMVIAYFMMATQGQMFTPDMLSRIWLPMLGLFIFGIGGLIVAMSVATKLDARPQTRKIITGFSLTLLLVMTLVVFRLSGIGV